jgi:membrane protease YdiL (CAAX protease family)
VSRQLAAGLLFAVLAVVGAELRGRSLVGDTAGVALATSLALGLAVAAVTLLATTHALRSRRPRIREWVEQLGGSVDASGGMALAVGAAAVAAVSEELFFRGLLLPWIGLLASSLLFGAVHLVGGGGARWIWALAAALLGLALGAITELTGSLAGPLVAHALVNVVNVPRVRAAYARGRLRPGSLGRRSGGKPLGGLLRAKP